MSIVLLCLSRGTTGKSSLRRKRTDRDGSSFQFLYDNGLLYRKCISSKHPEKVGQLSLYVPTNCRTIILSSAHESPLAGHFSRRKTEQEILEHFCWPGMGADIRSLCRSHDKCQPMSAKGRVPPVPIKTFFIMTEPFSRVAIGLVGSLSPSTSEGNRCILTGVDLAAGFPETVQVPLRETDTISVTKALW